MAEENKVFFLRRRRESAREQERHTLLEGLEQFKAKKVHTVTMKMGHPHSPMILTDGKDDLAMVLPVRLKEVA